MNSPLATTVDHPNEYFTLSPSGRVSRREIKEYLYYLEDYPQLYAQLRAWHLEAVGKPIRETVQYYKGRRGERLFHGICITR